MQPPGYKQISITNVYLPVCPHQLSSEAGPGVPVIPQGGAAAGLQAHQAALHLPAHLQSERRTVVTWPALRQSQLTSTPSLPSSKVVQESKLTETFLYICWVIVASINGCPGWATDQNNVMKLNKCIFRTEVIYKLWSLHAVRRLLTKCTELWRPANLTDT